MDSELVYILLASVVLPIVLSMTVVLAPYCNPTNLWAMVEGADNVIDPMLFFLISIVPVPLEIPRLSIFEVVLVIVIDPVPVFEPIVLPVMVPIFTLPAWTLIPYQELDPAPVE